jgi:HEAT repeat protein
MPPQRPSVAELVGRLPEADTPGQPSKFTGPEPEKAESLCAEVIAGGPSSLLELIRLIREPAHPEFKDFRAEYLLHLLAVRAGRPGLEGERRMLAETLASQLANAGLGVAVRRLLIRELQVAGGKEAVKALGSQLLDGELGEDAAQALVAIREGAAAELRGALAASPTGKGRGAIVQALGALRDAESVGLHKQAAGDADREVRIAAVWSLGNLGDPTAAETVLKAADAGDGWERIQAVKACLLLAENLLKVGKKPEALRIGAHLREARKEAADRYVREAAEQALAGGSGS